MFRDRILMTTLIVSFMFHVSMVTLFSIYVWVPVNRPKYAQLEIKYPEANPITMASLDVSLDVPSLDGSLPSGDLTLTPSPTLPPQLSIESGAPAPGPALPEIDLPSLDPALLENSRMIALSLRARYPYEPEPDQGFWAQSIEQLGRIGDRLRVITPFESVFENEKTQARAAPIARPAPGVAVYVEWNAEPHDRGLMLSPPIDAFWGIDAKSARRPISIAFKADAAGNVVFVLPPPAADETITHVAESLREFRFAPLDDPVAGDQYGTLIIAPESAP